MEPFHTPRRAEPPASGPVANHHKPGFPLRGKRQKQTGKRVKKAQNDRLTGVAKAPLGYSMVATLFGQKEAKDETACGGMDVRYASGGQRTS
ncbi:hypothetical protein [Pseudodesulfovibrio sp.]|uniref:hypothetical protein n=1 Tax=unclassified Pseudodesulfovibrio TaxID=2661612 RepID=UPI003AFF881D